MEHSLAEWQYPIGQYVPKDDFTVEEIKTAIAVIKQFLRT